MAEDEGFEPPRARTPAGFQDQSLQPDLGNPPHEKYYVLFKYFMVAKEGLEPPTSRV